MKTDNLEDLPFDQYQRYRLVQRGMARLRAGRQGPMRVLDVGGHAHTKDGSGSILPIRRCLAEDDVFVVDVQPCVAPGYFRGNGAALPFAADSFDVVVSCDTLEHVAPQERRGFLIELLRVSRDYLILVAPFFQAETHLADRILDLYITKTLGVTHMALREHILVELPRQEEIRDFLEQSGIAYVHFPSGYVYHWLIMMMAKHYLLSLSDTVEEHQMLDVFYNRHLSDFDHRPPAYRHVFVASKQGRQGPLQEIQGDHEDLARLNPRGHSPAGSPLLELLLSFIRLQREMGQERDWRERAIAQDLRLKDLESLAAEQASQLAASQARLAEHVTALGEAREALRSYHEHLVATQARLAECSGALLQTTEVLERFKKGRLVGTLMKAQELVRKVTGSREQATR